MAEEKNAAKLVYALPERLQGKKPHEEKVTEKAGTGHEAGEKQWATEEWAGAGADAREADAGVPGTQSSRGKPSETVEGREGWRD